MKWMLRSLLISSLLAFTVFSFLFFSETGNWPKLTEHYLGIIYSIILVNIGALVLYYINRYLNKHLAWNKRRALRFLSEFILGFIVFNALAWFFFQFYIQDDFTIPKDYSFWVNYGDAVFKFIIILSVLLYTYSLVNFSIYSYKQYSEAQISVLKQEREQLSLQFQALRSQLSPHFLFNALNTISSLSSSNIEKAEEYIRSLANVYRYILKSEKHKLVSLSEELDLLKAFYFLQQIKYEDWINLDLNISEEAVSSSIPPLTLQMLVENAIKHNSVCAERFLNIQVSDSSGKLIIENNINPDFNENGIEKKKDSHNLGLKNINKRYAYFSNKPITIEKKDSFKVELPLIFEKK